MKYAEKLKDPRWQKKRLEILQRDNWSCQRCYDGESTLHVHHRRYLGGKDPWEYDNNLLITLCENCHEYEQAHIAEIVPDLLNRLKEIFLSDDLYTLTSGFINGECQHEPCVVADAFASAFQDKNQQIKIIDKYLKSLLKKV